MSGKLTVGMALAFGAGIMMGPLLNAHVMPGIAFWVGEAFILPAVMYDIYLNRKDD